MRHRRIAEQPTFDTTDPAVSPAYAPGRYIVARLVIGSLLLFGGLNKVTLGQPMLLVSAWVVPIGVVIGWGVVDSCFGLLVLSFVAIRALRILLSLLFASFTLVLLLDWSRGATECQCLGGTGLPIHAMICLDLAVFACLFAQRRWWDQRFRIPSSILAAPTIK